MIGTRHFVHCQMLAKHAHFGRAAASLGISQPALTRSIQSLERELGVRLFDRQRGFVEPTAFGKVLLERGKRVLSENEELTRDLLLMQGLELGELTVSVGLYPAELSAHRAVGRMIRAHPNIRCRVKLCDWRCAAEDVLSREADLALAETSVAEKEPKLVTKLVGRHPLKFFCRPGHPLTARKDLTIEDVFSYPWVSSRAMTRMTNLFPKDNDDAGWIDPITGDFVCAIQVDSVSMAKQVVLESDAISLAPPSLIEYGLGIGAVVQLDFQDSWMHLNYGFIYLRDRTLSPATETFMKEVEAIEADLAARSRLG